MRYNVLDCRIKQIPQPMGSETNEEKKMKKLFFLFLSLTIFLAGIIFPRETDAASESLKVATYKYKGQPYVQITNHPNKTIANKINKTLKAHAVAAATSAKDSQIVNNNGWYKTEARTKYNKNGKLSVVYFTSVYYGGLHDIQSTKTYNFDTKTGKQIKLKDILNSKTKILKANQYTRYIFEVKNSKSDLAYDTEAEINMTKGSFYFRDNGITLIFDPYEVGSYGLGAVEVTVPQAIINGTQNVPTFFKNPPKNTQNNTAVRKSSLVSVYSNDGKEFLGTLSTNVYDRESIFNKYGPYGSEFEANSIWNKFGDYGSEFSLDSAFNEFTSSPPILVIGKEIIGYVTVNELKQNGISPYELFDFAKEIDNLED